MEKEEKRKVKKQKEMGRGTEGNGKRKGKKTEIKAPVVLVSAN